MTSYVKTLAGENLLIQIGDGNTPEVFTADCLINAERGVSMSADTTESTVIDCDDPTLPGWKSLFKDGLQISVNGAGKLHTASLQTWFNWMNSDTAKNIRIKFNATGALGGGYISCAAKLTKFDVNGPRKNHSTVDVTLMSDGAATWTANA